MSTSSSLLRTRGSSSSLALSTFARFEEGSPAPSATISSSRYRLPSSWSSARHLLVVGLPLSFAARRCAVTFFLSLSSVDEAVPPWMWGKTVGGRSQQPRNPSPPPISSLPLSHKHGNPPHSVSRTHALSLPQPRWEKTWPHRAPSSRRETKEGVRRAQKRMFCLCGYQEAGCCLYPPSREKRGGLKTAAPAPQPANPARRWR
mmetsp:Transcript_8751/g.30054  ORF Transcript_8751/g.30054 Transcript_8751/m.30054 type:complete len:203 (+) Transcript_8751:404-1012(+)